MRLRYWLLLVGTTLALIGLFGSDMPFWRYACLFFGGALAGVWAIEGERANMRERGIDLEPM